MLFDVASKPLHDAHVEAEGRLARVGVGADGDGNRDEVGDDGTECPGLIVVFQFDQFERL